MVLGPKEPREPMTTQLQTSPALAGKRILIGKPGLDGHDIGAKIVALTLRNAGAEVIYTGLRRRPCSRLRRVAIDEGVDGAGLSILSGSHKELVEDVMTQLRELGAGDVKVFVGGTIPAEDQPLLKQLGAAAIFTADMPLDDVVVILAECVRHEHGGSHGISNASSRHSRGGSRRAVRCLLLPYCDGQMLADMGAEAIGDRDLEGEDIIRTVSACTSSARTTTPISQASNRNKKMWRLTSPVRMIADAPGHIGEQSHAVLVTNLRPSGNSQARPRRTTALQVLQ